MLYAIEVTAMMSLKSCEKDTKSRLEMRKPITDGNVNATRAYSALDFSTGGVKDKILGRFIGFLNIYFQYNSFLVIIFLNPDKNKWVYRVI
jgi:hypothetical protein